MPSIDTILDRGFSNGQPWDRTPRRRAMMLWGWPLIVVLLAVLGGVVLYDPGQDVQTPGASSGGAGALGLVGLGALVLLALVPSVLAWISTSRKRRARSDAHPAATHALPHDDPSEEPVAGRTSGKPPRPVARTAARLLLAWVVLAVLAGGAVAVWAFTQSGEERAVGYVVSSPANCVLELSDRRGGTAEHTVAQTPPPRRAECEPPEQGQKIYYDPRTLEQVSSRGNDLIGVALGVGVALFFAGTGIAIWVSGRRRRRGRRDVPGGPPQLPAG